MHAYAGSLCRDHKLGQNPSGDSTWYNPGHGDDDARFYDRQQAYVHAHGG